MGFERAKIIINSPTVGTGLKVTLKKIRDASAKLSFSVNSTLLKQFGWAGKDKLEVLIGTGEHHGIIRVRKNNSTGDAVVDVKNATKGITYAVIHLGHQPMFVDRAEAGRWCQFEEIEDGFVEVILPRWADETRNAPKTSVAATPAAAPAAKPATPRVTATANLMGDPPPGRREMLDKVGALKP